MATSRTSSKLKGLLGSVIELVQVRFQLLTIEAREELLRLLGMVAFGAVAIVLLCMGLVFAAFWIIAYQWDTPNRLWTVFYVTLGFFALGGLSGLLAWSRFNRGTELFATSLNELREDVERLQP